MAFSIRVQTDRNGKTPLKTPSAQYKPMELPPLGVDEEQPILKKNRLSTGIPDLDIMMEGGYPNPGNVMFVGPTGNEKAVFAFHFASAAEAKKENVIIISADTDPQSMREKSSSFGMDLNGENIFFVDCYSQTLGQKKEAEPDENCISISGPGALNDLSIALKELLTKSAGKKVRVIFISLSTFVLYNPKDSIVKFLQVIEGRLKNADATALYLVEEGVHDKQLLSLMEHGMDEKLTLSEGGGKFELIAPSLDMPVPIKLSSSGIAVV